MSELKFGMSFHEASNYDVAGVIRYAQTVEDLGFDSLWITVNTHSGAKALEPLLTLGLITRASGVMLAIGAALSPQNWTPVSLLGPRGLAEA